MIGNEFYVRCIENGVKNEYKKFYNPKLYVKDNKKSKFKTLEGEYLKEIQPGSVKECREFISRYENVENFKIYGNERFLYQFISDEFTGKIDYNLNDIKIYSIDIETTTENGFPDVDECIEEILLITIQDYATKKITTFGSRPYTCTLSEDLKSKYIENGLEYIHCPTEENLLSRFIEFMQADFPDILTGHNIKFFDIPYICGRLEKVLGSMKYLSPWEYVYQREEMVYNRMAKFYYVQGISTMDYLELYKKFILSPRESYSLNYLAEYELGQKKLDHSEFKSFKDFYTNGWNKFVDYNIVDTVLVNKMEDKKKLIELAINLAYDAKVNYGDVLYQVRTWDMIIFNYLKDKGIIIPPKQNVEKGAKFDGAYVKEPVPGMYHHVVNYDLNSLYPNLIIQYNISPETFISNNDINKRIDELEAVLRENE